MGRVFSQPLSGDQDDNDPFTVFPSLLFTIPNVRFGGGRGQVGQSVSEPNTSNVLDRCSATEPHAPYHTRHAHSINTKISKSCFSKVEFWGSNVSKL